ncbi:MAG: DUF1850 domain-containing protein [Bacillota bacterium]
MQKFFRKKIPAIVFGLFLFFLVVLTLLYLFMAQLPVLVVAGERGPVLYLPLSKGETFSLTYLHSVQKTPVWENFSLGEGDRLVLDSTFYESLGVGLPFLAGEGKLANEHGRFILTGLNRSFAGVDLRIAPLARQALVYRGRRYDLNDLFPSDSLVRIRAGRCSPAKVIWHTDCGRLKIF